MNAQRFLVVMPTFNERDNLPRIVPRVLEQDPRLEILVVDDNSPDGTGRIADQMAMENPRVHVLHREGKQGLGKAYVAGFKWGLASDFQLFFEMDADLSHPPGAIPEMIEASERHAVVVGSRYVGGRVNVVNWPISRLIISLFGSMYARVITGLPIADCTGGFNCFRRDVLSTLDLDRIEANGYAFQIELKYRAWKRGFGITEVPIVFTERTDGESKMSKAIVREAIWRVWRLRFLSMTRRLGPGS
jgi:dolichol-phosphate mannosyltransferase